jgi:hypothetical protein
MQAASMVCLLLRLLLLLLLLLLLGPTCSRVTRALMAHLCVTPIRSCRCCHNSLACILAPLLLLLLLQVLRRQLTQAWQVCGCSLEALLVAAAVL